MQCHKNYIFNLNYSDEWIEHFENICSNAELVLDIRFESIKQELDKLVDNKIIKKLRKQICRRIKKGQGLKKRNLVN